MSLDLGQTKYYSEEFKEIPDQILELNFFSCPWLSNANLRKIIDICPQIQRLDLTSCGQINAAGWGELLRLKALLHLDVSRCVNVTDNDLMIIINSCPGLTHLTISECRRITDKGFHDIASSNMRLTMLNVGRTNIGDTPVIELSSRMNSLHYLDLTRCHNVTELGITEAIKNASQLVEINVTHCNIPEAVIDELRKQKPYLKIIFEG